MAKTKKPDLQYFDVDMCRTGVGFATLSIKAHTEFEAQELALDEAGNHSYSEKDSEYSLVSPVEKPEEIQSEAHVLQIFLELTCSEEIDESVIGVRFDFSRKDMERIGRLIMMARSEELSELRYFAQPDDFLFPEDLSDEERNSLDVPELVVGQTWISFEAYCPNSDIPMKSAALDLPVLRSAFESGAQRLILTAIYPTSDPLEFFARMGQAVDSLEVGTKTILISPVGQMTADEYASYLEELDDAAPAHRDN